MGEWYEQSFGEDYLLVYKHRDFQGAYQEVQKMISWVKLPQGSSVLDLCCGMGRHSLALADAGYKVTGVDLSDVLLREARAADSEGRVSWHQGDMRAVPLDERFDAVVNLFTSFGYFEQDEEQLSVLKEIHRLLKPGGRFIIDYLNPAYVAAHLVPHSSREDDGNWIEEHRVIEDGFVKKQIAIRSSASAVTARAAAGPDTTAAGEESARVYHERVKLYPYEKFRTLLEQAGLSVEQLHGSYNEDQYIEDASPRMIFVGVRA
ncbi:class I SAM-dependent methyltransferase [Paenibacillus farraposensis]|uniref:Class I SAM-dependent methyltransferase n=1 Tax=Paenibacillus farraposensis TaxID=2807095 RepID=A0ABW4DB81_9BACL|nr:class I SAM-dependent methyltransferase [Paenibacillus farraposensis]MCC3378686.1 methyltransferase domain-containing protein [Paenibacillus farraposensis]